MNRSIQIGAAILFAAIALPLSASLTPSDHSPANSLPPADVQVMGAASYQSIGDPHRDSTTYAYGLDARRGAGSVFMLANVDAKAGRAYRFSFRGLPQAGFGVKDDDDLYMKVEFFGQHGKVSYDLKAKPLFNEIVDARKNLSVNGFRGRGGAEVWQTYSLSFYLPFPQVNQLRLSVGFQNGTPLGSASTLFAVTDLRLEQLPMPPTTAPTTKPADKSLSHLLPIGGRWFYAAAAGESTAPRHFDQTNVDRLMYHDDIYSAPFAGNTTAWLRAGDMDSSGNIVAADRLISDNVTLDFDDKSLIIHTHGIPNHPTGKFPEEGRGNPNRITDRLQTYYLPLNPQKNPNPVATSNDNSNHALHMGPIGIAVNGVVFFNPFDAQSTVAVDLMDRCCGHPNQDGQYHYHKYPICINSPWDDQGTGHSPLIGWAFDGYPMYGPYESADVMAKDESGDKALNAFNVHYDESRGWHYHVTPGKFPYLIGGFWGIEDSRDRQMPHRGGRGGPPPAMGGPPPGMNGPPGFGPP